MTTPALSIRNLAKTYSNGFQALKGISFEVQQGDFYALLGPVLIATGLMLLLGVYTRISLAIQGLLYVALSVGIILLEPKEVDGLAVHLILVVAALMLLKYNRFTLTKN